MESAKNVKKQNENCHDCGKKIEFSGKDIKDGFLLEYKEDGKEFFALKCKDCFEKDQRLKNFRECEVYSRVCGYLRPVQEWNVAKRREFSERKDYKI